MITATAGTKVIYQSQPGERLRLLPNGSAIVVHPEREPFLVHPDGSKEPLTCKDVVDHQGHVYVAHDDMVYQCDPADFPPVEFYRQ